MWRTIRIGLVVLLSSLTMAAMAGPPALSQFESVGKVDSIAPYNGRVVISGKRYGLAKNVRVTGLKFVPTDVQSALFSIRDRNVGYTLGTVDGAKVVTSIMVLPEE